MRDRVRSIKQWGLSACNCRASKFRCNRRKRLLFRVNLSEQSKKVGALKTSSPFSSNRGQIGLKSVEWSKPGFMFILVIDLPTASLGGLMLIRLNGLKEYIDIWRYLSRPRIDRSHAVIGGTRPIRCFDQQWVQLVEVYGFLYAFMVKSESLVHFGQLQTSNNILSNSMQCRNTEKSFLCFSFYKIPRVASQNPLLTILQKTPHTHTDT